MVLNAVSNRLLTISAEELQSVFALLPPSSACLRFQIALCKLCLVESQSMDGSKSRPRPQARTAPRPLTSGSSSKDVTNSSASKDTSTLARKFPAIQPTEVLHILSTPSISSASDPLALARKLQLKFFTITALGELQEQLLPAERDLEWTRTVRDGDLVKSIDAAFTVNATAQGTDNAVAEDLKMMLTLASARWCR